MGKKLWSEIETQLLIKNWNYCNTDEQLSKIIGSKTSSQIKQKAKRMGLLMITKANSKWSSKDLKKLRNLHFSKNDINEIYEIFNNKTKESIDEKISLMIYDRWSQEEDDKLIIHYNNNVPIKEMISFFPNRTEKSIINRRRYLKSPIRQKYHPCRWTEEEICILKSNWGTDMPKEDLIKLLPGRKWTSVTIKCANLKLKGRKEIYNKSQRKTQIKKLLDESYESCYWLGFLLADGHFSSNGLHISLSIKDKCQIYKLKEYLCSKNKLINDNNNIKLQISDKPVIQSLKEKYDIKSNKTYNPPSLLNFPTEEEKIMSLIIGFIDGDGCIKLSNKYAVCRIACHISWKPLFCTWADKIFESALQYNKKSVRPKIYEIHRERAIFKQNKLTKSHMVELNISTLNLKHLKQIAIKHNLPVLNRKWEKV